MVGDPSIRVGDRRRPIETPQRAPVAAQPTDRRGLGSGLPRGGNQKKLDPTWEASKGFLQGNRREQ
jgi:hypothetical protein